MANIGKKAHKFKFTYKDISKATGKSVGALRTNASRGIFNPENLISLVRFISRYLPPEPEKV